MFKKLENTAEKMEISHSHTPPETIIPNIFGFHWLDFLVFLGTVKHQSQQSRLVPAVPPESTFWVSCQSCHPSLWDGVQGPIRCVCQNSLLLGS